MRGCNCRSTCRDQTKGEQQRSQEVSRAGSWMGQDDGTEQSVYNRIYTCRVRCAHSFVCVRVWTRRVGTSRRNVHTRLYYSTRMHHSYTLPATSAPPTLHMYIHTHHTRSMHGNTTCTGSHPSTRCVRARARTCTAYTGGVLAPHTQQAHLDTTRTTYTAALESTCTHLMHRTHPIHINVGFCFLMAPRVSARLRALCHPTRLCALLARCDARLNPSREGSDKGGLATGITGQ
jgi:hypothetical protein